MSQFRGKLTEFLVNAHVEGISDPSVSLGLYFLLAIMILIVIKEITKIITKMQ